MERKDVLGKEGTVVVHCPYCMARTEAGKPCPVCGLTAGAYVPEPHHLRPGTLLSQRYLVGRVLGEGGFGITYIGCDLRLELRVAIKEYYPGSWVHRRAEDSPCVSHYAGFASGYETGKARFLDEARTMARMDKQPEIVSVRDFFEENDTAYIVMEYVDGTTFKELVRQRGGRIEPQELFRLIRPLFDALAAMHEKGLIHRDISPDNLMLEHGAVRLLDFGCTRESLSGDETLTVTLKHGYAPIEQYQQKGQGAWTDVYALSATIYFCLTGRVPPQAVDRMVEDELISPRKLGVDIPVWQENALLRGMALRQHRRYRSMAELRTGLYTEPLAPDPEPPKPDPDPVTIQRREKTEGTMGKTEEVEGTDGGTAQTGKTEGTDGKITETETDGQDAEGRKRRAALLVGGAALAVILGLSLALPRLLPSFTAEPQMTEPQTTASQTADSTAQPQTAPGVEVTLEASAGEAELRAALADAGASSVTIPSGCSVQVAGEALLVQKPLHIEAGADVQLTAPMEVAEGGEVRVDGRIFAEATLLRVRDGGRVTVGEAGVLEGEGAALLESPQSLNVEEGGLAALEGCVYGEENADTRFFVLDEEALFAQAARVDTFNSLKRALESDFTQAIVVEGDIVLRGEMLSLHVPMLVEEGASLRGEGVNGAGVYVDGTVLLNRGTLDCAVQTADDDGDGQEDACAVVNEGKISGSLFLDGPGALVNLGDIKLIEGSQTISTLLCNAGEIRAAGDGLDIFLDLLCNAHNFGSIDLGEKCSGMTLGGDVFANAGTLRLSGFVENQGRLHNAGEIAGGSMASITNYGVYEALTEEAALRLAEAKFQNEGLVLLRSGEQLELLQDYGAQQDCGRIVDHSLAAPEAQTSVSSEAELRAALEDPACMRVELDAPVEIAGDLLIENKTLMVNDGPLALTGGTLTLRGEEALLLGAVDLGGGALEMRDGATAFAYDLMGCGALRQEAGAMLLTLGAQVQEGAVLDAQGEWRALSGLYLAPESELRLSGALDVRRDFVCEGARVRVAEGAQLRLRNATAHMDEGAALQNDGFVSMCPSTSLFGADLSGAVQNTGAMDLRLPVVLRGQLTNTGVLQAASGGGEPLEVLGALDNRGRLLLQGGLLLGEGGSVTGLAAERISEPQELA